MSNETTVVRALVARPVDVRLVLQRPELVPAEPGQYVYAIEAWTDVFAITPTELVRISGGTVAALTR